MNKDEALKLALEALENISTALREDDVIGSDSELMLNAITAIEEALAQPVQEPVGSVVRWLDGSLVHGWFSDPPPEGTLLYITPPAAQPEERWLCRTCNKSFTDLTIIHTCIPPMEST